MAMPSKRGRKLVSRHVKKHKQEGMPQEQAVAAALSEARRKGFKVSPRRRTSRKGAPRKKAGRKKRSR